MSRKTSAFQFVGVLIAAVVAGGFVHGFGDRGVWPVVNIQAVQQPDSATASSDGSSAKAASGDEIKAVEDRLIFNRALVDAAVLLTDFENYRQGKSKTPVSLSAFRSLEIRLQDIAAKDPSNTQARDMANKMQMAQFQLLGPSVAIAATADRQLYASALSEKFKSEEIKVSASGAALAALQLTSAKMTRDLGRRLAEDAKIPEQARRLEFKAIVFSNGKRKWRYVLAQQRPR